MVSEAGDDASRKAALKDHRTYTAAVRAETMRIAGLLDSEVYGRLSSLRKARNALIHNGKTASQMDAEPLFATVGTLFFELTGESGSYRNPGLTRSGGWVA